MKTALHSPPALALTGLGAFYLLLGPHAALTSIVGFVLITLFSVLAGFMVADTVLFSGSMTVAPRQRRDATVLAATCVLTILAGMLTEAGPLHGVLFTASQFLLSFRASSLLASW